MKKNMFMNRKRNIKSVNTLYKLMKYVYEQKKKTFIIYIYGGKKL